MVHTSHLSHPAFDSLCDISKSKVQLQGLGRVANTLIGHDSDGEVAGISGGERRRVSVGMGLVRLSLAMFSKISSN